ncbi:hypothetical protein [Rathayibacter sp. PhB185]|nr:hypothetical protein [Rathayibacter sp. PhB185]
MTALHRGPWGRLGGLIAAAEDGSDRERVRSAVARSVFSRGGKMVRYSPAAAAFGDGDERVDPSTELLAFVAHQYAVPEGFLTGADDNELRDAALHRALDERHLRGTPVPESFTTTTRCPTLAGELGDAGHAGVALRAAERRSQLSAIPYAVASLVLPALLTVTSFAASVERWQWFLSFFFLACTLGSVWLWTVRAVAVVRFFRLPLAEAQAWSDLLMKEAVATYFHDLYTDGYLPRAWFHDIFCRNLPITRLAWDRLGTGTVTPAMLTESAMRRFPAKGRADDGYPLSSVRFAAN